MKHYKKTITMLLTTAVLLVSICPIIGIGAIESQSVIKAIP